MCPSDLILVAQDLVSGDIQIRPSLKEYLQIQMNLTLGKLKKQGNLIKARYNNDPFRGKIIFNPVSFLSYACIDFFANNFLMLTQKMLDRRKDHEGMETF